MKTDLFLHIIPIGDNYCYVMLLGKEIIIIDPSDFYTVDRYLQTNSLKPTMLISSHHHHDHTGGNRELKLKYGCPVLGGSPKVPGIDRILSDQEIIKFNDIDFLKVLHTPGHTTDSICLTFREMLFTGDTLFTGGCGRIFEGTTIEMWKSLQKLKKLPDQTVIYCGHDYIIDNMEFALSQFPQNKSIHDFKIQSIKNFEKGSKHTPSTIGQEKQINPFFLVNSHEEFKKIRKLKDNF